MSIQKIVNERNSVESRATDLINAINNLVNDYPTALRPQVIYKPNGSVASYPIFTIAIDLGELDRTLNLKHNPNVNE